MVGKLASGQLLLCTLPSLCINGSQPSMNISLRPFFGRAGTGSGHKAQDYNHTAK